MLAAMATEEANRAIGRRFNWAHNDSLLFFSFASALHCSKSIRPSKPENHSEVEKPIAHFHLSAGDSHLHILVLGRARLSTGRVTAPNSMNQLETIILVGKRKADFLVPCSHLFRSSADA